MEHNIITGRFCRATLAILIASNLNGRALAQTANPGPSEPDVEWAESQAAGAYQAYLAGDYAAALRLYLEAYDAAADPDILYNIARIYEVGLRDDAEAAQFYLDFVSSPSADPKRVELALARLQALEAKAGSGASNEIASGALPSRAGQGAPGVDGAPSAVSSSPAYGLSAWHAGALAAGGAGLVALGAGTMFGVKALADARTARDDCDGNLCATERGVSAAQSAGNAADLATLSFAAGGLLIATAATLFGIGIGAATSATTTGVATPEPSLAHWTAAVTTADVRLGFRAQW